jgi:hypothetical protein
MKVIPPITITDAMLTSSTVAEPSAGETAWNAATNYAVGTQVIRTTTHRIYQNQIAGVDATLPENAPTRWLDVGPTNRWAMFDTLRNSASTAATSLTVVLTPGRRIDSIALMGLVGESVTISMTSGGSPVYSATENLILRNTTSWSQYFFGAFRYAGSIVKFDLPPYTNGIITVTVSRASGNVALGALVIGQAVFLGKVLDQPKNDALNFSSYTRAFDGTSVLVQRRSVPTGSMQILAAPTDVDKLRDVRSDLNAVPAVWSGLDDKIRNPNFEALLFLGIYKEFSIALSATVANVTLSLEEN